MTSKFSKIVQLHEKKVEMARMDLENANKDLANIREELENLERVGNDIEMPTSGNVGMIQYTKMLKDSYRNQLLDLRQKISYYEQKAYKAKYEVRVAQMEFEKFNHLHTEELKKKIKRLDEIEAAELDEIASMRHYTANIQAKEVA
ncbi:MAG: flagellar FliJ family protein [Campylobacterales bacterium]|nr:flagellar FliJ family protein [Campylobacterales bacterium]